MNAPVAFAQLTKIDVEKRLVYGRAAQETPDHSGEVMDYAQSKPHFIEWSDGMSKATGGMSQGNIRAMHGQVAAGKVQELLFNDDECAVDVVAKIVDDNEWQKCLEGIYTGFSIGGKYGARVTKGDFKHYEAIPSEISLVDRPCIPTATFFDIQKADGSVLKKAFQSVEKGFNPDQPRDDHGRFAEEGGGESVGEGVTRHVDGNVTHYYGTGGHTSVTSDKTQHGDVHIAVLHKPDGTSLSLGTGKKEEAHLTAATRASGWNPDKPAPKFSLKAFQNSGDQTMTKATDESNELNKDIPAVDVSKAAEEIEYQVEGTPEDADALAKLLHDNKLSIGDAVKAVQAATEAPLAAELAKRYAEDEVEPAYMAEMLELEKIAARADVSPKEGESKYGDVKFADEKNNKYPIENEAHIRAAWNYINKEKNAGKYSAEDLKTIKDKIIAAWKAKIDKEGPPSAAEKAAPAGDLAKGITDVAQLGQMLQALYYCAQSCKAEASREGDNSDIPARLSAVAQTVAGIYKDMATEEADELVEDMGEEGNAEVMQMAYGLAGALAKSRDSAADADTLQKLHDLSNKLGANCAPAAKIEPASDLTKMITDAVEPLNKALSDAMAKIAKLEAQPLPPKGVLRVVSKEHDTAEMKKAEITPVVERDGSENAVATMLKKIHATGGAPLIGGGMR